MGMDPTGNIWRRSCVCDSVYCHVCGLVKGVKVGQDKFVWASRIAFNMAAEKSPIPPSDEVLARLVEWWKVGYPLTAISFYKNVEFDPNSPFPAEAYGWHYAGEDGRGEIGRASCRERV